MMMNSLNNRPNRIVHPIYWHSLRRLRRHYLVGFLGCLLASGLAQEQSIKSTDNVSVDKTSDQVAPSTSKASDALPIELIANEGSYDKQAGIAKYQGKVEVKQGQSQIFADKMTIYFVNEEVDRMLAEGNLVKFNHLAKDNKKIYGEGKQLEYWIKTEQVQLTKQAMIKQDGDVVRGDKLSYNLGKERVEGSRIRMTISPQTEKNQGKKKPKK